MNESEKGKRLQEELLVPSALDGTLQPSLFYRALGEDPRPLLVGLHTWSFGRENQIKKMLPVAEKYNFHLLLPEFRGKNCIGNPELKKAMGSEYAKSDIKEAIDYVLEREKVDRDNIFLLGLSGGGHMALLMAGMIPEYFKAVGAAVPIVDLARWAEENPRYGKHVYACCGTDREEMLRRSPIAYLDGIARANVKLFHGKRDPVVPASHSLELFHRILEKYPDARVYLDIFDGAHEIDMKSATHWIMTQYKKTSNTEVTG